ncbi:YlqD family protein [Fredinandcohnia quinoae]|uniref:YlqD family protein n=1 Tax=Fredinandcohnia quinoae TaxID=2918902 RepID=A0AAW5DT12_9BACI|nr:YlqD family protein [Fredinandcohnia sp. SECRCQ15]MCH1623807.1 YlqD family protein [Fredinandcohnia sp. SECRCQ15]
MKILQTVVVKQVLTENSKKTLLDSILQSKNQLHKECEQLQFELKKMEKTKKYNPAKLQPHFLKEINNRQEKIKLLDFQIEQIHMLPLGSELKEKEVQSIIEVNKGDDWAEITSLRTIVIKEGIVEDIR